ncbi:MAG TPA: cation diffusion facilitator family transporter [Tepidisphaeraceae bacterium]|jgi:cation diffusion facilitator family transporter|nr:cation diffusion facilitator family transporter [Tepidisphaeraceae bacterium]
MPTSLPPTAASEFVSGTEIHGPSVNPRVEFRIARIALFVAIALLVTKFTAYAITGSAAIFSDALESVVNVAAAIMAIWALAVAHRPADQSHPYGHGKVEFIGAALEGGMILLAAVAGALKAIDVLLRSPPVSPKLDAGLALMAAALVVNGVLGAALVRMGRRRGSLVLEADGRHLLSDALTSVVAVASLWMVRWTGKAWIDPLGGLIVSVWIAVVGVSLIRRSVAGLMDQTDPADDALLRRIINRHIGDGANEPRVCSFHKLRHRHSGRYHWVDFHLKVPADWDIQRAHEVASAIEYEIELALVHGNATAHVEPCGERGCGQCSASR